MGVIDDGACLQNEVKGWPCLIKIGTGFDLVTNSQWWADEATPTTKATAVPSSGEASLDTKFTEVIKCVTDAAAEGFSQRYTYANEPRIRAGTHLSALVWVATTSGGSGITVKLRNSDATVTSATSVATDGDWTLLKVEDHTCAGTYVELVVTKDASGTFYAGGPITVMVGADAIGLPPRGLVTRYYMTETSQLAHDLNGSAATARTDLDLTSFTSALAAIVVCSVWSTDNDSTDEWAYHVYPNFYAAGAGQESARRFYNRVEDAGEIMGYTTQFEILMDDAQIIEDELTIYSGTNVDVLRLYVNAWREWE